MKHSDSPRRSGSAKTAAPARPTRAGALLLAIGLSIPVYLVLSLIDLLI